jgi:hypothetical protein
MKYVPNIPPVGVGNERQVLMAAVDVLRFVTAQTKPEIAQLPTTATTAEIVAKVNQILARLQGTA